jgi:4-amino-4-deoxy-L-arabinose transferase-like glycosyltransferase
MRGAIRARSDGRSRWRALALLFVCALALRVVFATVLFPAVAGETGLNQGSDGYEKIARNLLAGEGFRLKEGYARTTLRMPLYPGLLAGIFATVGDHLWAVQAAQALLSAGTATVLAALGWTLFGRRAGLLAGWLWAVYPGDLVACSRYLVEPLTVLLLLLAVVAYRRLKASGGVGWALVIGLLLGVSVQAKSANALLPLAFLAAIFTTPAFWRPRVRVVGAALGVVAPVAALAIPWVVRGQQVSGHWFFPSTLGGYGLLEGHFVSTGLEDPQNTKSVRKLLYDARAHIANLAAENDIEIDPKDNFAGTLRRAEDEVKLDRLMKAEFQAHVAADPRGYAWRSLKGLHRFWHMSPTPTMWNVALLVHLPLLALGVVGLLRAGWRRGSDVWLWLLIIGYYNVLNALIDPLVRYALAAFPFVMLLCGAAFAERSALGRASETGAEESIAPMKLS